MLLVDELRFQLSFFLSLVPIALDILKFLAFALFHTITGTDPEAPRSFPSVDSLPSPKLNDSRPYALMRAAHPYRAPGRNDSRSPCPALNTMANHGYIPHDGRKLTGTILTHALMECYALSWPLAAFLAWGGVLLLGQSGTFSLHDLARHNHIEHDASLTHPNTPRGAEYAPARSDPRLFDALLRDARAGAFRAQDIARARVRREDDPASASAPASASVHEPKPRFTGVQQEIARGEVALVLQVFGADAFAVPVDFVRSWWGDERLPEEWRPTRKTTLLGTVYWSTVIRHAMERLREKGDEGLLQEKEKGKVDVINHGEAKMEGENVGQMTWTKNADSTPPTANGALESESDSENGHAALSYAPVRQQSIPIAAAA